MNLHRLLLRWTLGQRLPLTHGKRTVPGVRQSLQIHRDRWGIPYVETANDADAWFGLGFCHGQDRAFQLEILLRVVRGTLSELVGIQGLPIDRLSRRIGFHRAACEQWPVLDADVREWIEAYARGVVAGTTVGLPKKSHEFVLLRNKPSTWTPFDCLGVVKLISFTLPANWDVELARLKILSEDGPDALAALEPHYPEWLPATTPPGAAARIVLDRLTQDLTLFAAVAGTGTGSNNWALSSHRTATGRPLLANDPHLDARLPSHWYLVHVRTPEWAVAGASFVGGPGILCGHNGHAAWGLTAGLIDNTDLFWEQIGPDGRRNLPAGRGSPLPAAGARSAAKPAARTRLGENGSFFGRRSLDATGERRAPARVFPTRDLPGRTRRRTVAALSAANRPASAAAKRNRFPQAPCGAACHLSQHHAPLARGWLGRHRHLARL